VAAGIRSVHRSETRCRLPLTEELKTKAMKLYRGLEAFKNQPPEREGDYAAAEVPEQLIELLQDYFFTCVTGMVKEAMDETFATPVQAYMACFGYREDDTFKTPPEVTSVLAQWQYLLRCTALYHATARSKRDKTVSAFEWVPSLSLGGLEARPNPPNPGFSINTVRSTSWRDGCLSSTKSASSSALHQV